MSDMKSAGGWSGPLYSSFRLLFGLYLAVHFAGLLPWGAEVFSGAGVISDGQASPLFAWFPSPLQRDDRPWVVTAMVTLGLVAAVAFAAGFRDRWAAAIAWFVLACLFARNPLISNPSLPHVGWLLLAHTLIPKGPLGSFDHWLGRRPKEPWHMPRGVFVAAWIVMALAYSYSGYTKLSSPSWWDGTAMFWVLENPLARTTALRAGLLQLPMPLWQGITWGALGLELCFAPLALFKRTRPLAWTAMVAMHIGLLLLIDFSDLTIGMLILHGFTFHPSWGKHLRTLLGRQRTIASLAPH